MHAPVRPTTSVEDYVKAIYKAREWHREPVTTSVLAAWFGVAAPSVSDMVRKLADRGLVDHVPYKPIELTERGRLLAMRMVRRHRLIETYLVRELGYTWDEVHDEAEVLEHAVSDTFLDRIAHRLGDPRHDPHGDPIPGADGAVALPAAVPLPDLPPGLPPDRPGTVVRVSDADPGVLRALSVYGIGPGTSVRRLASEPGPVRVDVDGAGAREIPVALARAVWVEPPAPDHDHET